MEIYLKNLNTFYDIPSNQQTCFFCLIDTVHWVSIDLGVLICSNCVAKCRTLGTPTVSIKLDLIHITNNLKRKVLINLGYDYKLNINKEEQKDKIIGLWKTRDFSKISTLNEIKEFIKNKKSFIENLNKISELNIDYFYMKTNKPNLIINHNLKSKNWEVIDSKDFINNNINKEESIIPIIIKKESPKNIIIEEYKNIEKVFNEEESSDILIDHSSNLQVSKDIPINKLYKTYTEEDKSTYEKISSNTKKAAKKVQEEVDKVLKKFR